MHHIIQGRATVNTKILFSAWENTRISNTQRHHHRETRAKEVATSHFQQLNLTCHLPPSSISLGNDIEARSLFKTNHNMHQVSRSQGSCSLYWPVHFTIAMFKEHPEYPNYPRQFIQKRPAQKIVFYLLSFLPSFSHTHPSTAYQGHIHYLSFMHVI